jgi:hypothetical protein
MSFTEVTGPIPGTLDAVKATSNFRTTDFDISWNNFSVLAWVKSPDVQDIFTLVWEKSRLRVYGSGGFIGWELKEDGRSDQGSLTSVPFVFTPNVFVHGGFCIEGQALICYCNKVDKGHIVLPVPYYYPGIAHLEFDKDPTIYSDVIVYAKSLSAGSVAYYYDNTASLIPPR